MEGLGGPAERAGAALRARAGPAPPAAKEARWRRMLRTRIQPPKKRKTTANSGETAIISKPSMKVAIPTIEPRRKTIPATRMAMRMSPAASTDIAPERTFAFAEWRRMMKLATSRPVPKTATMMASRRSRSSSAQAAAPPGCLPRESDRGGTFGSHDLGDRHVKPPRDELSLPCAPSSVRGGTRSGPSAGLRRSPGASVLTAQRVVAKALRQGMSAAPSAAQTGTGDGRTASGVPGLGARTCGYDSYIGRLAQLVRAQPSHG